MEFYLKIRLGIIVDAKFQTTGCTAARASGSALTKIIKGKTLKEAEEINPEVIIDHIGGLPPLKVHCACLAKTTLEKAIEQYRKMEKKI
ncbi:iron-sulfur cluster assembly scaffold protein [candidate division WOR-3 bacterium]|nr:iron-sulfur cluster assembly scaffold protein [candidate division WOR-3 bacterium]